MAKQCEPLAFEGLPEDAVVSRRAGRGGKQTPDVLVAFIGKAAQLSEVLERWAPRITGAQMLWVCWPKLSSGVATDVRENLVRERGLGAGLVDNKVCAVDETWSGLRLVRRVKDRLSARRAGRQ